jgi:hypothetical protein
MKRILPLLLLAASACTAAPRVPYMDAEAKLAFEKGPVAMSEESEGHGLSHTLIFYLPNRIFDIFDIVRARARLGPGFGIGGQATHLIGAHADWYTALWLGLPGPRLEPALPIPFGSEAVVRASVTVMADVGLGVEGGREYGYGEFELEAQFIMLGADIGIDPWEFVDLVLGLATLDPVGDDM